VFNEAKQLLNLVGGTLNVDDSTLDKPYSQHMEVVGHFWSYKCRFLKKRTAKHDVAVT
jgi:hypothetical protein